MLEQANRMVRIESNFVMALCPHEGIGIMETYMFIPLILSLSDDTGAGWRLGWSNS